MRSLLLSSLFIALLCSCNSGHYKSLERSSTTAAAPKPIFGENFNSFLFKANIDVYGRKLSGLLITKQVEPRNYRVIFTTELGIKLFDFEFRDSSFTLHYSIPQFNRPKLLNMIRQDIQTLLMNDLNPSALIQLQTKDKTLDVFKQDDELHDLYYFSDKSGKLERIERGRKNSKRVTYHLQEYKDQFPNRILIDHHDAKLDMELNLLKR
jgi:hypothetical protein